MEYSSSYSNNKTRGHHQHLSSSSSSCSSSIQKCDSSPSCLINNNQIINHNDNNGDTINKDNSNLSDNRNNNLMILGENIVNCNNNLSTTTRSTCGFNFYSSSSQSSIWSTFCRPSSSPSSSSSSSSSSYSLHSSYSVPRISTLIVTLFLSLNYLFIISSIPSVSAQYRPKWPSPIVQREIFLLNLEDGYFGCQVNESTDFLQLFELSKLCDGLPQCFLGSDELALELKCGDRNHCHPKMPKCINGACLDNLCHCNDGFGGKGCDLPDENECKYRPCDVFAHCTNTLGSFYCTCNPGYEGDGFTCHDTNECEVPALAGLCADNAECCNLPGHFSCKCKEGFTGNATESCFDIDECADSSTCGRGAECHNTPGGYSCHCPAGFTGNPTKECWDIDECKSSVCGEGAICTNLPGSYECTCPTGFKGDPKAEAGCVDVDECSQTDRQLCGTNANCVNTAGDYFCQCPQGYTGNARISCIDVDECKLNVCAEGTICTNLPGSYECTCPVGFRSDAKSETGCVDVDECSQTDQRKQLCGTNANCVNTVGDYFCQCPQGYTGNARIACTDINECATNACGLNTICTNILGGYNCQCKPGFTGDAFLSAGCTDINECIFGPKPCGGNTSCVNTDGAYKCICLEGFIGNPKKGCKSPCEGITCSAHASCQVKSNEAACVCDAGYTYDPNNISSGCVDINECAAGPYGLCGEGAICINTIGGHQCKCPLGYTGDPFTFCEPGCLEDKDCPLNQGCVNEQCVDPCASKKACGINAVCLVEYHKKVCSCGPGTEGNARIECTRESIFCENSNDCENGALCEANICRSKCGSDNECFDNEKCADGVCTSTCKTDETCPSGFVCELGQCRIGCRSSNECPSTSACINRKCIDPCASRSACGTNAICRVDNHEKICSCKSGTDGNPRIECTRQSLFCENANICGKDAICEANVCRSKCDSDDSCLVNEKCANGLCTTTCSNDDSCPPRFVCEFGQCQTGCRSNNECPSSSSCLNRKCIDPCALKTACGTNAICRCENHEKICSCKPGTEGNPRTECIRQSRFCDSSNDCGDRAVCEANVCRFECYNDAECFDNEKCFEGFCTSTCKTDESCSLGFVCELGQCKTGCRSDNECPTTASCINRKCIDPCASRTACGTNAVCRVDNHEKSCSCKPGTEGNPRIGCTRQSLYCENSNACGNRAICEANVCRFECYNENDCFDNEKCSDGFCTSSCKTDESCPGGFVCDAGQCKTGCRSDKECPSSAACMNRKCIDPCASKTACGANAICRCENHEKICSCKPGTEGNPRIECVRQSSFCESSSDCGNRAICEANVCRFECYNDAECFDNEKCAEGFCTSSCKTDEACPPGFVCESGKCKAGCRSDVECSSTGACMNNKCIDPCASRTACGTNAICRVENHEKICSCGPGTEGNPRIECIRQSRFCESSDDCGKGAQCDVDVCRFECNGDEGCFDNEKCADGFCTSSCKTDESCPPGFVCDSGQCKTGCRSDNECPLSKACMNHRCIDVCGSPFACGTNAKCTAINHSPWCTCPPRFTGNPRLECKKIECVSDADCATSTICINYKCVSGLNSTTCRLDAGCRNEPPPQCNHDSECVLGQICENAQCIGGCRHDNNCPEDKACINTACENPCLLPKACGHNTVCQPYQHRPRCECQPNFRGNPFTGCDPIPDDYCDADSSCPLGKICENNKCLDGCRNDGNCKFEDVCINKVCTNPCSIYGACGNNAICKPTNHDRVCTCKPDHTGDPKISCERIRPPPECLDDKQCPLEHICQNTHCVRGCRDSIDNCPTDKTCIRGKCIDPCSTSGSCGEGAICSPANHVAVCSCPSGFRGDPDVECREIPPECRYDADCGLEKICLKQKCITGCRTHSNCPFDKACFNGHCQSPCNIGGICGINTICRAENHEAQCTCVSGYTGDPLRQCTKIHVECETDLDCGQGYVCAQQKCRDINECLQEVLPCGPGASCQNLPGFFKCSCPLPLVGNAYSKEGCRQPVPICFHDADCKDDQKCNPVTQECYDVCTKSGICGKGALCRSLNSKAECECLPGHRGNPYVECSIRDSCSLPSDCPGNLLCLGQYCGCPYPYEQRSSFCVLSSLNCTTTNPCPNDQTCIYDGQGDKTGYCACPKGYMMTLEGTCRDYNECEEKAFPCGPGAKCMNKLGSYDCRCPTGTLGDPFVAGCLTEQQLKHCFHDSDCPDDRSCIEFECRDSCLTSNNCGQNAICYMEGHRRKCKCRPGFSGNPTEICRPIADCVTDSGCPGNLACLRDHRCGCPLEFNRVLDYCVRFSYNCSTTNPCPDNQECIYSGTESGFCVCPRGFTLRPDGVCDDINECNEKNICGPHASCVNRLGTYECRCAAGYQGEDPYRDGCTLMSKEPPGCLSDQDCPSTKKCDFSNGQCFDPCTTRDENRCGANALCSTSNHIVSCSCPSGFEGNPNKLCSPIRECGVTYQCPGNLVCLNSRTCGCPSNYSRENDYCLIRSQNCTTTNPCPPNEECVYTGVRAGFCICPHGYELTPRGECKEIPVCARDNPCAPGAICRDQPGSYVCICPVDTIGDPYVKGCDQVFGCQTNSDCPLDKECDIRSRQCISPCHTCGPNAECAVRDHKAVCVCAPGQVGQADDKEIGCFVPPPPPDVPTVRTIPPVQDLTVMCLAEGVQVAVRLGGYDGIIYVKGHSQDPNCRRLVTSQERDSIDFKVNFSVCGLVPINGEASFILVIQKHPKLVTYRARAYHIKCLYMSGERTVTLGFNVSMITTSGTIANTGPPPTCLMSITSIDGKEVTSAEIGDDLLLKVDVQPDFIYGGFARSCVAKTMEDEGEFQYEVTDANGCATDPSIFGNWEYDTHKKQLMARFNAFKFPSSNNLRFQCNIRVCFGSCPPVNCDGVDAYGKRRRRGVKDEDLLADAFKEGALREEIMVQSNAILTFEKRDPQPSASLEGQRLEDADHICLPKLGLIISMILTTLLAIVAVAFAISCWLMAYRRKPRRPGPLIHPPDFPNPLYTSPEHVAEPSPDYYHGSHL